MKKLFLLLVALLITLPSQAIIVDNQKDGGIQSLVNKIGFRILNSNRISERMVFTVSSKKIANAAAKYADNEIVVYQGIITTADDDDEIAAILAHEIGHGVDFRQGVLKGYFSCFSMAFRPRKYEYMADKHAVDFMVKSGYHPVAFITMMNKIGTQYRYEWYLTHPLTSRRLATVYEYIYAKYPQFLVDNKYKDNLYYQNFLLTSRENRLKLENKVKANSKRKIKYL